MKTLNLPVPNNQPHSHNVVVLWAKYKKPLYVGYTAKRDVRPLIHAVWTKNTQARDRTFRVEVHSFPDETSALAKKDELLVSLSPFPEYNAEKLRGLKEHEQEYLHNVVILRSATDEVLFVGMTSNRDVRPYCMAACRSNPAMREELVRVEVLSYRERARAEKKRDELFEWMNPKYSFGVRHTVSRRVE